MSTHVSGGGRCRKCNAMIRPEWRTCEKCTVVERTGADVFECDCGQVVPIHESVRMMRKDTRAIERVCTTCATEGACRAGRHTIVTPNRGDWNDEDWTFDPVPDNFPKGFCTACHQQLHYDSESKRWTRMDWHVLASAWETARA